jgi:hypothetical protein
MKVTGLHKINFDEGRFREDVDALGDDHPDLEEIQAQLRSNHENAWLIVVEHDGEIDCGQFAHPKHDPNAQSPWLEQVISETNGVQRVAFFMHFVEPAQPLWYGKQSFKLPPPTPAPADLVELMEYSAP